MTSDEIKQKDPLELGVNAWLREVCIQLALLNEQHPPPPPPEPARLAKPMLKKAG